MACRRKPSVEEIAQPDKPICRLFISVTHRHGNRQRAREQQRFKILPLNITSNIQLIPRLCSLMLSFMLDRVCFNSFESTITCVTYILSSLSVSNSIIRAQNSVHERLHENIECALMKALLMHSSVIEFPILDALLIAQLVVPSPFTNSFIRQCTILHDYDVGARLE